MLSLVNYFAMKTQHIPTVEATRSHLYDQVMRGKVIHGSLHPDLDALKAYKTRLLHVNDVTGERVPPRRIVAATGLSEQAPGLTPPLVAELAIFYGAVRSVMRDSPIKHSTSIKPVRDGNGNIIDHRYYLDDAGKEYIARRESTGGVSAVYIAASEEFTYAPNDQEYVAEHDIPILGSIAVTSAHLLHNIYELPSPASDPEIVAIRARFDAFTETRATS
jgi:hypothetical protein